MPGKRYGYVIALPDGRSIEDRLSAMRDSGVEERNIVTEAATKENARPRFSKLMERLRPGDMLIVESLDGLGNSDQEIVKNWARMDGEQVSIVILDMPLMRSMELDSAERESISKMALQMLAYFSANQKQRRRYLQRQGIEAAKASGVQFGRPKYEIPQEFVPVVNSWRSGEITALEAANRLNMSVTTFYRRIRKYGIGTDDNPAQ